MCRLSHLLRDARLGLLSSFHVHNTTLSFLPVPPPLQWGSMSSSRKDGDDRNLEP